MELTTEEKLEQKRINRAITQSKYRAKNFAATSEYNRNYFASHKTDIEFMKKHNNSVSQSKIKRKLENKKGVEANPIRQYIHRTF